MNKKILENYINGKFIKPIYENYLDNYNPSTGKCYNKIPDSTKEDIDEAVIAAKKAFKIWSKTTVQERSNFLNKIANLLEIRIEEFAEAESIDQGKPISLAKSMDITRAITNFRFFAGAILHHQENSTTMDQNAINYTVRSPIGVAGLISPWNLPLYLLTWKIAPALAGKKKNNILNIYFIYKWEILLYVNQVNLQV